MLDLPGIGEGDTEAARMIVMKETERFMARLKRSAVLVLAGLVSATSYTETDRWWSGGTHSSPNCPDSHLAGLPATSALSCGARDGGTGTGGDRQGHTGRLVITGTNHTG